MAALEIVRCGPGVLVEDLGRPGHAALGVGPSGAADRSAMRLANALVGNDDAAAGLEILLGGLDLLAIDADVVVASAGAVAPMSVGGVDMAPGSVVTVRRDNRLTIGQASAGLRICLAVRGGIDVRPVLGSRSTDLLAGIGPEPVRSGDVLTIGRPSEHFPLIDLAPVGPPPTGVVTLQVVPGPHDDLLDEPDALFATTWTVASESDRTGIRLDGTRLGLHGADSLASEGVVRGAIQVVPSGLPLVFLADHPVTGGYPVVGVVLDRDVDRAAQVRPGQRIRLRRASARGAAVT